MALPLFLNMWKQEFLGLFRVEKVAPNQHLDGHLLLPFPTEILHSPCLRGQVHDQPKKGRLFQAASEEKQV